MGHSKELITVDIYGDNCNIIPEEIPELVSYMADVMPNKKEEQDLKSCVLDAGIEIERYLPRKNRNNSKQKFRKYLLFSVQI